MTRAFAELREIAMDYATHRDLLWQLVLRDVRVRYKQAAMGFLWALFMPVLLVLAGLLVRHALVGAAGPDVRGADAGSVAARGLIWASFAAALSFATASLTGNAQLVGKVYFPREVLPVAAILAHAFDGIIAGAVLVLALPWLGGQLTAAWCWVPLLLIVLLLMTIAAGLALSAANLFFRDVKYIVQAMLSVGVLFTPVLYSPAETGAVGARWLALNPLTPILEGTRLAIFEGHNLVRPLVQNGITVWSPWMLAYVAAIAIVGLLLASVTFHRAESVFAERL